MERNRCGGEFSSFLETLIEFM